MSLDNVPLTTYTVVGVYADNHNRYASSFEAISPAHAEALCLQEIESPLIVAGVFVGDLQAADTDPTI